jgi:hypothetical protein
MKVKVISVFRDKFTSRLYSPDELIEIEDDARVENLVDLKLVEPIEEKKAVKVSEEKKEAKISLFEKEFEKKALIDALKSIGVQAAGNMKEETLLAKVAELDEESTAKLKEALGIE